MLGSRVLSHTGSSSSVWQPQSSRTQQCSIVRTFRTSLPRLDLLRHAATPVSRNTRARSSEEPAVEEPAADVRLEGALPEGVSVEIKGASESSDIEYDQDTKTLRIPLSAADGSQSSRRTRLVIFTCNKCGGRTARNVNPIAWDKGLVFGQCGHCEVWHTLSAKNPDIYEEVLFDKVEAAAIRAGRPPVAPRNGSGDDVGLDG